MNLFDSQIKGLEGLMSDVVNRMEILADENERLLQENQYYKEENAALMQQIQELQSKVDNG